MLTLPKNSNISTKNSNQAKTIRLGSIAPIKSSTNAKIFCQALEAICELGYQVSVLAEGNKETQKCCFDLLEKYPQQFKVLESISKNEQEILNNVDAVIFAESPNKKTLAKVIANNIVPIIPEGNGVKDFDLKSETGEAFTFQEGHIWAFVAAIVKAGENFKFPYDWKTIKHNLEMIVF